MLEVARGILHYKVFVFFQEKTILYLKTDLIERTSPVDKFSVICDP